MPVLDSSAPQAAPSALRLAIHTALSPGPSAFGAGSGGERMTSGSFTTMDSNGMSPVPLLVTVSSYEMVPSGS